MARHKHHIDKVYNPSFNKLMYINLSTVLITLGTILAWKIISYVIL